MASLTTTLPRVLQPICRRKFQLQPLSRYHEFLRYTHSHSLPKHTLIPNAIEWLPLPRSLTSRKALMLLSLPISPNYWPSHLEMASPLLATTSANLKSKGIAVNAIYDGVGKDTKFSEEEVYRARVFWPDGNMKVYEGFRMENLSSDGLMDDLGYTTKSTGVSNEGENVDGDGVKEILVCTHGSRDCRCSDRGGPLVEALREEVERRGLEYKIRISEIAHVGGHKYAANAILLPSLDMLSNLTLEHAPSLISQLLSPKPESKMWNHWRGRYGLTEEEQGELWAKISSNLTSTSTSFTQTKDKKEVDVDVENVELKFKTFEGELKVVHAKLGDNLLEVGKENSLPSLEGICGGNLECATCHLYLPNTPTPAPVGEVSEEELDMLGYALGYKDGESRLGCQVKVTKELGDWCKAGGVIGLPRF